MYFNNLRSIVGMKIFIFIILLFTVSCASVGDFVSKVDFEQRLRENTFDSDIYLRKTNQNAGEVTLVKLEEIKDIPASLVDLSSNFGGYGLVHTTRFATDEGFVINEQSLKDFAKSKNCELVVYIEAEGVLRYNIYNDNKTINIIKRQGTTLFNAFLFSKVEMDRSIKININ